MIEELLKLIEDLKSYRPIIGGRFDPEVYAYNLGYIGGREEAAMQLEEVILNFTFLKEVNDA